MSEPLNDHAAFRAAGLAQTLAREQGFALCGIASARASAYAEHLSDWLAAGKHGEMHYLADHADIRADPGRLVEGAVSVLVVADAYVVEGGGGRGVDGPSQVAEASGQHSSPEPLNPLPPRPKGAIAKYAWGDDYHKTIKKRLHAVCNALEAEYPGHVYRATTDTAPIFERELATRAGLGWTGKHTLMIHPRYGSYFLLGTVVTTLEMQTSELAGFPAPLAPPADHCGACTRCIDACPTDAIAAEGYSVDARRCISYLTLEHRGPIDERYFEQMGDWVAGCDICQDVCPHNRRRQDAAERGGDPLTIHPCYAPHELAGGLDLLDVLGWSAEDRRRAFTGSALKRVKLEMLHRNALIASGNALMKHDDPALRQRIERIANDGSRPVMVRETAAMVLRRLADGP